MSFTANGKYINIYIKKHINVYNFPLLKTRTVRTDAAGERLEVLGWWTLTQLRPASTAGD